MSKRHKMAFKAVPAWSCIAAQQSCSCDWKIKVAKYSLMEYVPMFQTSAWWFSLCTGIGGSQWSAVMQSLWYVHVNRLNKTKAWFCAVSCPCSLLKTRRIKCPLFLCQVILFWAQSWLYKLDTDLHNSFDMSQQFKHYQSPGRLQWIKAKHAERK